MSDPTEDLAFASEFPAATREQWLKLVEGVLKGAPFHKRLIALPEISEYLDKIAASDQQH